MRSRSSFANGASSIALDLSADLQFSSVGSLIPRVEDVGWRASGLSRARAIRGSARGHQKSCGPRQRVEAEAIALGRHTSGVWCEGYARANQDDDCRFLQRSNSPKLGRGARGPSAGIRGENLLKLA